MSGLKLGHCILGNAAKVAGDRRIKVLQFLELLLHPFHIFARIAHAKLTAAEDSFWCWSRWLCRRCSGQARQQVLFAIAHDLGKR